MQVKNTQLSDTRRHLAIVAEPELLIKLKTYTLTRLAPGVKVAGFREGKAPAELVERGLNPSYLQTQFLDDAINQLYLQAVNHERLRPVSPPQVNITKFVPFTTLEFSVEVEVVGDIVLPDYKKLKHTKPKISVTQKDIDLVLEQMALRAAEYKDVERDAKTGDRVWIDFQGTDTKGEPVNGADGKDYPLLLGSKTFIPGFEDHLIGVKPGARKSFTIPFPKTYGVKALQGKKVTFEVTVKKVQQVLKPKLDDDFAKSQGETGGISKMKQEIKKELQAQRQQEADLKFQDDVVRAIAEKTTVAIPEVMVEDQVKRLHEELRRNLVYRNLSYPDYLAMNGWTEEQHNKDVLRPEALDRLKAGLLLSEVAEQEKLFVTPEELDNRVKEYKERYKNDPKMLAELNKAEHRRDIAARILTEKTIDKLIDYATR